MQGLQNSTKHDGLSIRTRKYTVIKHNIAKLPINMFFAQNNNYIPKLMASKSTTNKQKIIYEILKR